MTLNELASELKNAIKNANEGEKSVTVILFGIKYAEIIKQKKYTSRDISRTTGLEQDLSGRINAGINLASYVDIKKSYLKKM